MLRELPYLHEVPGLGVESGGVVLGDDHEDGEVVARGAGVAQEGAVGGGGGDAQPQRRVHAGGDERTQVEDAGHEHEPRGGATQARGQRRQPTRREQRRDELRSRRVAREPHA